MGDERHLAETAIFMPLGCSENTLLFGDVRYRQDNQDNHEGNAGIGIRDLREDGILGGYAYFDRKRSFTDKLHSQVTLGGEWLSEGWEARANAYIPVTGEKLFATGTPAGTPLSAPFLQGSGIYINQAGHQALREMPLYGGDIEGGIKIPDNNVWLHMAAFRFDADDVKPVTGARVRATWNVTDNIAFFAEGQNDTVRGDQGWIGARLTVPFGGPSQKPEGLKARMTASPVRDIDIVTSGKVERVTPDRTVPVLNTESGAAQRVLHVDNTAAAGGDGTLENPFNMLSAAQAVLQDYDTVYIRTGDGTTSGQNAGLTVAQNSVQVIGEGSAFIYDRNRFTTSTGSNPTTGTVIKAAGLAPVITNTGGNGVTATGDNALLAGFTVDGAAGYGISGLSNAGTAKQSILLDNLTVKNNASGGVSIISTGAGSTWGDVTINKVTTMSNVNRSMRIYAESGGNIGNLTLTDIMSSGNTGASGHGVSLGATGAGSTLDNITASNIATSGNTGFGMIVGASNAAQIGDIDLSGITATSNSNSGVYVTAETGGDIIGNVIINDVTATGNSNYGLNIISTNSGSILNSVTATNVTAIGNASYGALVYAVSAGQIGTATLSGITATANAGRGVYATAQSGGIINDLTLTDIASNNNTGTGGTGVEIYTSGTGSTIGNAAVSNVTASGNSQKGVSVSAANSSQISTANLSGLTTTGNSSSGTYVAVSSNGSIGNVTLADVTSNNNTGASGYGVDIYATGANGVISSVTASNIAAAGNAAYGIYVHSSSDGLIGGLDFSDVTVTGSGSVGLYAAATSGGDIGSLSLTDAVFANSGNYGLYALSSGAGSTITDITARNLTVNDNSGAGLWIYGTTDGQIGTVNLSDSVIRNNNGSAGVYLNAAVRGVIGMANLSGLTIEDNAGYGLYLNALSDATLRTKLESSIIRGNRGASGVFVNDDTNGPFAADLGGGALGSVGGNSIYGNLGTYDIIVDLDGLLLKAENNWWGMGTGLAGGRVSFQDGSSIDADPWLTTAP